MDEDEEYGEGMEDEEEEEHVLDPNNPNDYFAIVEKDFNEVNSNLLEKSSPISFTLSSGYRRCSS